jgi:hypothetical protein
MVLDIHKTPGLDRLLILKDGKMIGIVRSIDTAARTYTRTTVDAVGVPNGEETESYEGCEFRLILDGPEDLVKMTLVSK